MHQLFYLSSDDVNLYINLPHDLYFGKTLEEKDKEVHCLKHETLIKLS
jgi:hypothetical protein